MFHMIAKQLGFAFTNEWILASSHLEVIPVQLSASEDHRGDEADAHRKKKQIEEERFLN